MLSNPPVPPEADGGVIGGDGDADAGIGRRGLAFRGGDVGAAFQQLRRYADGNLGQRHVEGRIGNAEIGQAVVGDGAHGVLKLGPSHAHIDELGAHGFELGLGLGDIGLGGHAAFEAALGQIELAFEVGDGALQQLDLRVKPAELEVIGGHLGLQREVHVGHVGGVGLRGFARGLHAAPDFAPEIGLPPGLAAQDQVVVVGMAVVGAISGRCCEILSCVTLGDN